MSKPSTLAIVLGGKGDMDKKMSDDESKPDVGDEDSSDDIEGAKSDAAEAVFDAVKNDDKSAFASALDTYVGLCMERG